MRRKVTIGPERIDGSLQALLDYLTEARDNGAPDDAKIRIDTASDGPLLVNVEYEEEVGVAAV